MNYNKISALASILFVFLLLSTSTQAQDRPPRESLRELGSSVERKEKDESDEKQALEKAIDAEEYLVGPGDVFFIQMRGPISRNFRTVVTPEGKLIIPEMESFEVDQQTLASVQRQVTDAGKRLFNQTIVTADLFTMRTMRVHVVGQVVAPGSYIATPIDRITDMLKKAGGFTNWAATESIEIKHQDQSIEYFNYSTYRIDASLSTNIYVRSGDVIFVPPVNLSKPIVRLEADNAADGVYQITHAETVEHFLLRIGVLHSNIDFDRAVLVRLQGDSETGARQIFQLAELLAAGQNGKPAAQLMNGDRVIIPGQIDNVYVRGAVQNPGAFPFFTDFTAEDYVGLAGGTVDAAGNNSAYVIHDGKKQKGKLMPVHPGDTVVVPESMRAQFRDYFGILAQIATLVIAIRALK